MKSSKKAMLAGLNIFAAFMIFNAVQASESSSTVNDYKEALTYKFKAKEGEIFVSFLERNNGEVSLCTHASMGSFGSADYGQRSNFDWANRKLIYSQEEKRDNGDEGERWLVIPGGSSKVLLTNTEYHYKKFRSSSSLPEEWIFPFKNKNYLFALMNFRNQWRDESFSPVIESPEIYNAASLIRMIRDLDVSKLNSLQNTVLFSDKNRIYKLNLVPTHEGITCGYGRDTTPGYRVSAVLSKIVYPLPGSPDYAHIKVTPGQKLLEVDVPYPTSKTGTRVIDLLAKNKVPTRILLQFNNKNAETQGFPQTWFAGDAGKIPVSDEALSIMRAMEHPVFRNDRNRSVEMFETDGDWSPLPAGTNPPPAEIFDVPHK